MTIKQWLGSKLRQVINRGGIISEVLGKLYSSYRIRVFEKYNRLAIENLRTRSKFIEKIISERYQYQGNVIIIVVDCLRYKNTNIANYHRDTTPFLSTFTVKMKSYAASSQTYSSVPSILTGLYPHNHGSIVGGRVKLMRPEQFRPLYKSVILLPEVLYTLGYEISFITSVTTAALPFLGRLPVIDLFPLNASKVLSVAKARIRHAVSRGKKFFAYIHLGDTHVPLRPPRKFENYFGKVKKLKHIRTWAYTRIDEQHGPDFEEYRYNKILLYDNTIRYVDYAIEKFVESLEDIGILDETLIVVTADHGEEFWEHALLESHYFYDPRGTYGTGHGHNFFDEIIATPLFFLGSDLGDIASLTKGLVSSVDIVPTVLDWLGIKLKINYNGVSLLNGVPAERGVISEAAGYGYEKKVLIKYNKKLLYSENDKVRMVFDLAKDPAEQKPIFNSTESEIMLRELRRLLIERKRIKYIIK